jgi:uncharacterized protein
MHIQHKQTGHRGMFFIQADEEDEILAELSYNKQGEDTMVIEHTEVDDALRGQNVGFQLVEAAVHYARSHGWKIIAICSFASGVIEKKPEFQDVLCGS